MNIVLFSFFQIGTGAAVSSVVIRENLVRKMHFPRIVIPLATVTTQAINLVFNMTTVVVSCSCTASSRESNGSSCRS